MGKKRPGKRERAKLRAARKERQQLIARNLASQSKLERSPGKSNIDPDVLGSHAPRYREIYRKIKFEPPKKAESEASNHLNSSMLPDLNRLQISELVDVYQDALKLIASGQNSQSFEFALRLRKLVLDQWRKRTEYFQWPATVAPLGAGDIGKKNWEEQGLLNFLGYAVGARNGKPTSVRQLILDDIFLEQIPFINSVEYISQWGTPNSAKRLQKLAESIASFTRNAKRQRNGYWEVSIKNWEADLKYLYDKYYVGHFDWPSI